VPGHGWPVTQPAQGEKRRVLRVAKRVRRVSFLLVSFSLDKQRKVTRAIARKRKPQAKLTRLREASEEPPLPQSLSR
jgi:hypothetical protein